jgi:antirestriction protein ArdC
MSTTTTTTTQTKTDKAKNKAENFVFDLIKTLEAGDVLTWRKTWKTFKNASDFCNAEYKNPYSGGNILQVFFDMLENGYADSRYLTYNQIIKIATKNKIVGFKDKEATKKFINLVYCTPRFVEVENPDTKQKERKVIGMFWNYTANLYNIELTNLADLFPKETKETREVVLSQRENESIAALNASHLARYNEQNQDRAFYVPAFDHIVVPQLVQFNTNRDFIATLAHEQAHATGHKTRLGRNFDQRYYAFEELVAELASFMFLAHFDLDAFELNSKAYIINWAKRIRTENTSDQIFKAFGAAHKAYHYMITGEKLTSTKQESE